MHNRHNFGADFLERIGDLLRLDNVAPRNLHFRDFGPATFRHIHHAPAEDAVHSDQNLITRLDQIDETKLHSRAPRSAHREGHFVFRHEDLAKHHLDLLHHLHEYWVQMPEQRHGHGPQYRRGNVAWSRPHQNAFRRLKSWWN